MLPKNGQREREKIERDKEIEREGEKDGLCVQFHPISTS